MSVMAMLRQLTMGSERRRLGESTEKSVYNAGLIPTVNANVS